MTRVVITGTHKGGKIIDASSGLFCCSASHSRPEIAEAVYQQLQEVAYTPHFQMEHPSSFKLAQQISAMTPDEINHVFFNNSGSESVDTALIPYKGNRDWLEDILFRIKDTLMADELPEANQSYDLNTYYYERAKIEA